jgi:hypothetical protein
MKNTIVKKIFLSIFSRSIRDYPLDLAGFGEKVFMSSFRPDKFQSDFTLEGTPSGEKHDSTIFCRDNFPKLSVYQALGALMLLGSKPARGSSRGAWPGPTRARPVFLRPRPPKALTGDAILVRLD